MDKQRSDIKQSAARSSVAASTLLTLAKFAVGFATGSLAILSEAIHSLLDLAAAALTLFAVRMSDKPADDRHHYGHGKVESVTALIETGLLFVTSAWIVQEAVRRLMGEDHPVEANLIAFAVVIMSIAVDFWRGRALSAAAKQTNSPALEADALHFSSDMWSSLAVLVGLAIVRLGFPKADAIAALAVACFVILAAWRLGQRTIDVLMDAAPEGVTERIKATAGGVEGVVAVDDVKVRPAGSSLFVDVSVSLPRTLPLDGVAALKGAIAEAIVEGTPEAEVRVNAIPIAIDNETVRDRVMVIATNRRLAVHHVTAQSIGDRLSVGLDLEVNGQMPLGEAHKVASGLEGAIRSEFGHDIEVETHIEPLEADDLEGRDLDEEVRARLAATIAGLTDQASGLHDAHYVRARTTARGLIVTLHCRAAPNMTVDEVHARVDALEHRITDAWPGIVRIVTHSEPTR